MSQEMDEYKWSVVAVKFTIKKEFVEPEELEASQLFIVWMGFSQIYKLFFYCQKHSQKW